VTLLLVALAWLAGSIAAALDLTPLWPLVALGGGGVCAGLLLARRMPQAALLAIVVASGLIAIGRYESARPSGQPAGIAVLNDGPLVGRPGRRRQRA
jgi:hypothetical protein